MALPKDQHQLYDIDCYVYRVGGYSNHRRILQALKLPVSVDYRAFLNRVLNLCWVYIISFSSFSVIIRLHLTLK